MTLDLPQTAKPALDWLIKRPIAHRGLHDAEAGVPENTLEAVRQAIAKDYAVEVDLQPSADRTPMVFHDYRLERLTGQDGNVRDQTAAQLANYTVGGKKSRIPTLKELLATVDGKVPLVIELKGQFGMDEGFVPAVIEELKPYRGNVALMSFNHWLISEIHAIDPAQPLGLVAEGDDGEYPRHQMIAQACDVDFVSYALDELDCRFVREFSETGRPVISWTVKSPADAARSAKFARQITFEGFLP